MIERNLPAGLGEGDIDVAVRRAVSVNAGLPEVTWIGSHLATDRSKFFCVYEAPTTDAVREAARLADIPCDAVTEVRAVEPTSYADSRL
jgi:Protein of unknown function (DUF4242)